VHYTVLAGGTGAAKFLLGLIQVVPQEEIHVIVNVGDDAEIWGLHVSPDIDTILYALSGRLDTKRGWGLRDETFHCLSEIRRYGLPDWFQLGDADLATHLARTDMLRRMPLSAVTQQLSESCGVKARVFPATNDRLRTRIETPQGTIDFQEFFVRDRCATEVRSVTYAGAAEARPAEEVIRSIREAELIIVAPSNPITSIGPILAIHGIRDALRCARAEVVAISPIIGNKAVSGPAGKLMDACGYDVSPAGVARFYHDFLNDLIVHTTDAASAPDIRLDTIGVQVTNILMPTADDARRLAQFVVQQNRNDENHTASR
jgi:LPPG:FO 2-phospho-L-lactate transferase